MAYERTSKLKHGEWQNRIVAFARNLNINLIC